MSGGAQIDDGQAAVAQGDAGFGVGPMAFIIGAAVMQASRHGLQREMVRLCQPGPGSDKSRNSTHGAPEFLLWC
jgi:hypothetical protein